MAYLGGMLITREQLYQEVWAKPMLAVAQRHRVSGSFLARICRRLNVPCPPRGYWAQKAAGLTPPIPALPGPEPGDELGWSRGPEIVPRQPYPEPSLQPLEGSRGGKVVLPKGLHPLLVGAEAKLADAREGYNTYLKPSKRLMPDLYVTKASMAYALETANRFFRYLSEKGHRVDNSPQGIYTFHRPELKYCESKEGWTSTWDHWHPARPTFVYFGTLPIGLTLFNYMERVEAQQRGGKWVRVSELPPARGRGRYAAVSAYSSTHDFVTGRIALRAYSPYEAIPWERTWVEPEVGGLVEMFESILASLRIQASKLVPLVKAHQEKQRLEAERRKAERQAWLAQRAIEEEQERLAALERARKKAIQDSKDELLALVKGWDQAKRMQAFLAEVQGLVEEAPLEEQARLWERLEQARAFLGSFDLLAQFSAWRTPVEREISDPSKDQDPPPPQRDASSLQHQQTEAQLRNEVDLWRRRYIFGRR